MTALEEPLNMMAMHWVTSKSASAVVAVIAGAASVGSLIYDVTTGDQLYWLQRSGALLILAAIQLQYSKLTTLWNQAVRTEQEMPIVEERQKAGVVVSMRSMHDEGAATRNFAIRLHGLLTQRDWRDVAATVLLGVGTLVWAYGDLPFRP